MLQFVLSCIVGLVFSSFVQAAPIAIMDSGTDLKHPRLVDHAWMNPHVGSNGFVDDVHGWNFIDQNNELLDESLIGTFSPDSAEFFMVQLKMMDGTATEAEQSWMNEKRQDEQFMEELSVFASFAHGTHVAGIASRQAEQAKIMVLKIIGGKKTESESDQSPQLTVRIHSLLESLQEYRDLLAKKAVGVMDGLLMKGALSLLAGNQVQQFKPMSQYLAQTQMKVVNCSFGSGGEQSHAVAQAVAEAVLSRALTEDETAEYGNYFMQQLISKGGIFPQSSPGTLFVIAAGNDGSNNDEAPVFPANIKAGNLVSVAATRGFDRLAGFSNYGVKMVDLAAPGVGIVSTIPGDGTMVMSGTSQAAPFVARVAGLIFDANPKLTPVQVKSILMKTVDPKSFLMGKVAAEGTVNEERALYAARLSNTMTLRAALHQANTEIAAVYSRASFGPSALLLRIAQGLGIDGLPLPGDAGGDSGEDGYAFPLPPAPVFQF